MATRRLGRSRTARRAGATVASAAVLGGLCTPGTQASAAGRPQHTPLPGSPSASAEDWANQLYGQQATRVSRAKHRRTDRTADGALPASSDGVPPIFPKPRSAHPAHSPKKTKGASSAVPVPATVRLVTADAADPAAVRAVRQVLSRAGAEHIRDTNPHAAERSAGHAAGHAAVSRPSTASGAELTVYVGGASEHPSPAAEEVLRQLGAPASSSLPRGGYVLASGHTGAGHAAVVLAGRNAEGTFDAAQTLRQLVVRADSEEESPADGDTKHHGTKHGGSATTGGHAIASAVVRDWPAAAERGIVEGHYGTPWTHQQRLDQLDFLGETKQNVYLYAPGADPYRQSKWRSAYPTAAQRNFRKLARRARRNHVRLDWAVSPGQDFCYSDSRDIDALAEKLDAMWQLGVRGFQLRFNDVSYAEWHCGQDNQAFGDGAEAAARAQAHVANELSKRLRSAHSGAVPLSLLPTEFYQDGSTPYRKTLAEKLHSSVSVTWSGVGVMPRAITAAELHKAGEVFGRHPVTMDNYPINDSSQGRLYLGPATGRAPEVAKKSSAMLANAMVQPVASRVALSTAADFAWNPEHYDAQRSWLGAVRQLSGGSGATARALWVLARNEASSPLGQRESEYLRPKLRRFLATVEPGGAEKSENTSESSSGKRRAGISESGRHQATTRVSFAKAAKRLRAEFTAMRRAPGELQQVADGELAAEVGPWLEQLARFGAAGEHAVDMFSARRRGDGAAARSHQVRLRHLMTAAQRSPVTVGEDVLAPFLKRALTIVDSGAGRPSGASHAGARSSLAAAGDNEPARMPDRRDGTHLRGAHPLPRHAGSAASIESTGNVEGTDSTRGS